MKEEERKIARDRGKRARKKKNEKTNANWQKRGPFEKKEKDAGPMTEEKNPILTQEKGKKPQIPARGGKGPTVERKIPVKSRKPSRKKPLSGINRCTPFTEYGRTK